MAYLKCACISRDMDECERRLKSRRCEMSQEVRELLEHGHKRNSMAYTKINIGKLRHTEIMGKIVV